MFDCENSQLLKDNGYLTTLGISFSILGLVDDLLKNSGENMEPCLLKAYENGREHGFQIAINHLPDDYHVAWSENRNSDDIVVYHGPGWENMFGKTVYFGKQEEDMNTEWETRSYFNYNQQELAADFIASVIIAILKEKNA